MYVSQSRMSRSNHVLRFPAIDMVYVPAQLLDFGRGIVTTGNADDYLTGGESCGVHGKHAGEGRLGISRFERTTGDNAVDSVSESPASRPASRRNTRAFVSVQGEAVAIRGISSAEGAR